MKWNPRKQDLAAGVVLLDLTVERAWQKERRSFRLIGQLGLTSERPPFRHPAKRRRIRTVLQELMHRAAQFIRKARQRILDFGLSCPVVAVFRAVQEDLLIAGRSP